MPEDPTALTGMHAAMRRISNLVNSRMSRPDAAALLAADDLLIEYPTSDTVWTPGSEQVVRWFITGPVDPVDIHLVQRDGSPYATRAVLAEGLPSHKTSARVTLPAGIPAGEYLILVTTRSMLDAYSRPFRISAR
ncbi:GPI anchored serine-threonine rich family protein [Streptomyces sp. NPDC057939]|uniref:GPI anchored serine-threonine rich family protein n=1 Tax=Streptomyces sp. NPDC057939 TaxID=3346284 RepID=UPI0036E5B2D3